MPETTRNFPYFNDRSGRKWIIDINVSTIRRVRNMTETDLCNLDPSLFKTLSEQPIQFADVLWAIVQPEAEKINVTDEDFGTQLAGDAFADAADAFLDAIECWQPERTRPLWRAARAKGKELAEKELAAGLAAINRIDTAALEVISDLAAKPAEAASQAAAIASAAIKTVNESIANSINTELQPPATPDTAQ